MRPQSHAQELIHPEGQAFSSNLQLLFGADHLDIWWNPEKRWAYLDWKGQQTQESIRQGAECFLELMGKHGIHKVLNDNTNTTGSWISSLPWVIFNFLPRAKKAGLQKAAHVYSRDKLARLSAEASKLLFDPTTSDIRMFNSVQEAKAWLELNKLRETAGA